jgi:hypothetical protein
MRDMDGLADTRKKLLLNKDSLMINWVGYVVALHLKGAFVESLDVLESVFKLVKENNLKKNEVSELNMYKAVILRDMGNHEELIKFTESK